MIEKKLDKVINKLEIFIELIMIGFLFFILFAISFIVIIYSISEKNYFLIIVGIFSLLVAIYVLLLCIRDKLFFNMLK